MYCLAAAIASIGLGIAADQAIAQTRRCTGYSYDCSSDYYSRPVNTRVESGVVTTQSGIGLNIRSGPGLDFPIIDGAEDGAFLDITSSPVFADGYRWARVSTGGWVATDYISGDQDISLDEDCYRSTSYYNGNCVNGAGGPAQPTTRPVVSRPIPVNSESYIVAIPGSDRAKLTQLRRIIPNAFVDRARQGEFLNAGAYNNYDQAQSLSNLLQGYGFNARVLYR
ncbi:MAG: SH3 domain-containing protein [Leptolyngbyaceae cyanobacterium RU_5_1]|nr:SH3 domain-containing protein [Leptolyngbyaceae cyanobacterium RU_5_1]